MTLLLWNSISGILLLNPNFLGGTECFRPSALKAAPALSKGPLIFSAVKSLLDALGEEHFDWYRSLSELVNNQKVKFHQDQLSDILFQRNIQYYQYQ